MPIQKLPESIPATSEQKRIFKRASDGQVQSVGGLTTPAALGFTEDDVLFGILADLNKTLLAAVDSDTKATAQIRQDFKSQRQAAELQRLGAERHAKIVTLVGDVAKRLRSLGDSLLQVAGSAALEAVAKVQPPTHLLQVELAKLPPATRRELLHASAYEADATLLALVQTESVLGQHLLFGTTDAVVQARFLLAAALAPEKIERVLQVEQVATTAGANVKAATEQMFGVVARKSGELASPLFEVAERIRASTASDFDLTVESALVKAKLLDAKAAS